MSRRRAFWIAVAMLIGTLFPLFLSQLQAGRGAWLGLTGGVALLGLTAADQLVGRPLRDRVRPLADAGLVLLVTGLLAALWVNFLAVDAWQAWWGRFVLIPIVAGAIGFPILRWLGESFRPIPFWTVIGGMSGVSSSMMLYLWRWNKTRYDPNPIGPEEWVIATLAASPWVLLVPLLAIVRLGAEPVRVHPRRWVGTIVAGALIGLAHADTWTQVRYDRLGSSYSYGGTASDAFVAAAFGSVIVLYALVPTAISRLVGVPEHRREPIIDEEPAPATA